MQPFEFVEPRTIDEAVALLSAQPESEVRIIAGASDLLSEIKEGVIAPRRLVSLGGIPELRGIQATAEGLRLGAMTTITEIAQHPAIVSRYASLAQAAQGLATWQIRNVGTLGGNLAQRPRCWYYRHPLAVCLKKGGDRCYALAGVSKHLCVTGGDRCYIVHPSDTAVALSVFDAQVEIAGPSGSRSVALGDFFAGPGRDLTRENILEPGELVTGVVVVQIPPGPLYQRGEANNTPLPQRHALSTAERGGGGISEVRSLYLKARERETGDFALVSVALALELEGGIVRQARCALGGVAPVPYRAHEVEEYLQDKRVSGADAVHAGSLALSHPRPMAGNGYKVPLARNLVKRAVAELLR
ncbi:MAG: xanthine dehydrogenase family protein subunit M [SAR202 cluster bacterium]|nr:xanthine dehydrogenase family protein subunit M [SAR202 cluster bacterium]